MLQEKDKAKMYTMRKGYKYRYVLDWHQVEELEQQGYICVNKPEYVKQAEQTQKPKKQVSINSIEEETAHPDTDEAVPDVLDTNEDELEAKLTVNKPKRRK